MEIHISKVKKEISLREKYSSDTVMNYLLACNHDIRCINLNLKHYGSVELTLEEIGLILDVTRERVRQIETSALRKLRQPNTGRLLKRYIEI